MPSVYNRQPPPVSIIERPKDRARLRVHRAEGVVEGDGERPRRRWVQDRIAEGRADVALAEEGRDLSFDALGRQREHRRPAFADGVVAENEHVAHQLHRPSTSRYSIIRGS